jgi:peptidoglycan/LPS O-acetylase OafA/YrhL
MTLHELDVRRQKPIGVVTTMGSKSQSIGQIKEPMSFSSERKIVAGQGEIFELTGLRGVAALMVALLHSSFDVAGHFGAIYDNLTRIGFLGVDLFFILSGFVIAYKYHDIRRFWSRDYGQFLWFRFWRIYPAHFFVTMFYVPVVVMSLLLSRHVDPERFSISSLIANLLLVQSWLGSDAMTWNIPAWSVSAEWLAYVLFPILITLSSQVPRSLVIVACGALLLLVPVLFATLNISGAGFTGLVRLFPEFLSGCLIWRIYSHDMTRARIFDIALIVVLVLILTSGLYLPTDYPFLVLPLFACAIYLSCRSIGIGSRILSSRPMVYLGTISYSLYLVHWTVFTILRSVLPASAPLPLRLLIALPIAILCAALTYHFVEAPCRRFGKTWWGAVSSRPPAAVRAG